MRCAEIFKYVAWFVTVLNCCYNSPLRIILFCRAKRVVTNWSYIALNTFLKKLELHFKRLLSSKGVMGKWLLVAGRGREEGTVWVHGEMVNWVPVLYKYEIT